MQLAVRSSFSAGVAIVGAGLLIAAPVKPVLPELPDPVSAVRSAAVELSAAVSPFIVSPTEADASNPAAVVDRSALLSIPGATAQLSALPDPAALLAVAQAFIAQFGQALADAPAQVQQAIEQIMAGQITQALNTAVNIVLTPVTGPVLDAIFSGGGPLVDLVDILQPSLAFFPPAANVLGLLKNPDFLLTIGLGPLQSVYSLTQVIGGAAEAVLGGIQAGDPAAVVNGIVKGLVDLQGTVVTQLFAAGTPPYYYDRGLIGSLLAAGQMIIDAITAPAAPATAVTSDVTADAAGAESSAAEPAAAEPDTDPVASEPTAVNSVVAQPAADEPGTAEPETAEQVTAAPVVEETPAAKPEVRDGLVAVPGVVTVGVAKDDEQTTVQAGAEHDSTTDDSTEGSTGTPATGSTGATDHAGAPSGSNGTAGGGDSTSDSGSTSDSDSGSGD